MEIKAIQKNEFKKIFSVWRAAEKCALIWDDTNALADFLDYLGRYKITNMNQKNGLYIVLYQSNYLKKDALIKQWSQFKSRPDLQVAFTQWLIQTTDANLNSMHPRLAQSIDKQHLTSKLPEHLKNITHMTLDKACFQKRRSYLEADPKRELIFVKDLNFLKV